MQRISKITAHNFMTFSDVSLEFNGIGKCYIIKGENKDDAGQQSNGSGKTSLIDILAVALLGESLTGRDLKDCVNWNSDESFFTVSVTLINDLGDSDNFGHDSEVTTVISRKIYNNTRVSELSISLDGTPPKGVPSKAGVVNGVDAKAGNQYILDFVLGVTKEDLLNYFLISGDYQSFFNCGNAKKIEIINRFSKAQIVDKAIESITAILKRLTEEAASMKDKIATTEGHIAGLKQSIDTDAIEKFHERKKDLMSSYLVVIEGYEAEIKKIKIKKIKETDWIKVIAQAEKDLKEANDTLKELKKSEVDNGKETARLQTLLAGEIECPACEHHFVLEGNQSIDEIRDEISMQCNKLGTLLDDIDETTQIRDEAEQTLQGLKAKRSEEYDLIQFNNSESKRKAELQLKLAQAEKELLEADAMVFDDSEVSLKIERKKNELDAYELDQDMNIGQTGVHTEWLQRFKNFKFFLANKPVEIICHYTNEFLKTLNSELSITIEGFKVLKSGDLKAELTPIVYRNGLNPKPYSSFSAGEQVRLNIAVDLALQRLVNENSSVGLQFYSSDELLNSLDSLGLINAAKAFNCLGQTICLISHSGSELNYDNVITVTKKNNISTIQ